MMSVYSKEDLQKLNALYESKDSWESKSLDPLMQMVLNPPTFKLILSRSRKRIPIMERTVKTINCELLNAAAFGDKFIRCDISMYLWKLPSFGQYIAQLQAMGYHIEFANSYEPSHNRLFISWESPDELTTRKIGGRTYLKNLMKLRLASPIPEEERDYREIAMINKFIRQDSLLRSRQLRFDMRTQQFNSSRVRKHFQDLAASGYDVSLHPDTFYIIRWQCYLDPKHNFVKQSKLDAYWNLSFLDET
jgi:hypothetical protein